MSSFFVCFLFGSEKKTNQWCLSVYRWLSFPKTKSKIQNHLQLVTRACSPTCRLTIRIVIWIRCSWIRCTVGRFEGLKFLNIRRFESRETIRERSEQIFFTLPTVIPLVGHPWSNILSPNSCSNLYFVPTPSQSPPIPKVWNRSIYLPVPSHLLKVGVYILGYSPSSYKNDGFWRGWGEILTFWRDVRKNVENKML